MDEAIAVDELGPVDYIVVEFPGSKFNGEIAPALADLVDRGLVRVLDLLILKKDTDGSVEAFELSDLGADELGVIRSYESKLAMLLSEDDVTAVAAALEPGSSAGVLVWENTWAAPFASAVRKSGGQLVAGGRIPIQAILAAVEADEAEDSVEEGVYHAACTSAYASGRSDRTRAGRPHGHHCRHGRGGRSRCQPPHGPPRRPQRTPRLRVSMSPEDSSTAPPFPIAPLPGWSHMRPRTRRRHLRQSGRGLEVLPLTTTS